MTYISRDDRTTILVELLAKLLSLVERGEISSDAAFRVAIAVDGHTEPQSTCEACKSLPEVLPPAAETVAVDKTDMPF